MPSSHCQSCNLQRKSNHFLRISLLYIDTGKNAAELIKLQYTDAALGMPPGKTSAMQKRRVTNMGTEIGQQLTNEAIADHLDQIADYLELQEANPHRVRAYRMGAKSVRTATQPLAAIVREEGSVALERLPEIGRGLAWLIGELVNTGRSSRMDRLRGEVTPEDLFQRVPGVGPELAHRIVETLNIGTLPELEQAAHDGRLETVAGFGRKRSQAVRDLLATMLARAGRHRAQGRQAPSPREPASQPPVAILLAVDEQYRQRAAAGTLRKITPRRFNPEQVAWLPILHMEIDDCEFTALFSNTARAHELGKTDDWVVIYCEQAGHEGQYTVVTETSGPLKGQRVVRGRERESREYYAGLDQESGALPSTQQPDTQTEQSR